MAHFTQSSAEQQPKPPVPDSIIWGVLTNKVFEIGDRELTQLPKDTFADPKTRTELTRKWLLTVGRELASRRPGNGETLELTTGKPVHISQFSVQLQPMASVFLEAQRTGDMSVLPKALATFEANVEFRTKLGESLAVLTEMHCAPPQPTMDDIWKSFFNRAFDAGEIALADGVLTRDDLAGREPFLYLGLIATTALDLVKRNLSANRDLSPDAPFVLAFGGRQVRPDNAPPEAQQTLAALQQARSLYALANLSKADDILLRKKVLHVDNPEGDVSRASITPEMGRIVAIFSGIASNVSQLSQFKAHFENVLQLLTAVSGAA